MKGKLIGSGHGMASMLNFCYPNLTTENTILEFDLNDHDAWYIYEKLETNK